MTLKSFWDKKTNQYIVYSVLFLIFCVFAYGRTMKETVAGDFHVFWLAGNTLMEGKDIYFIPEGLRNFIYPPFAAFFFIPLSLLPFKVATFLFFLINFALTVASLFLINKILSFFYAEKKVVQMATIGAILLSFKLSWNNIMMIQTNQLVFFFSLLGIYYFLLKKENLAICFFCLAISLKIYPVFFAFWVIIRGSRSAIFKFILGGALAILLPMIFSGFSFGFEQLNWYLNNFVLKVMSADAFNVSYANQSLTGAFVRIFTELHDSGEPAFTLLNLGIGPTKVLITITKLCVFLSMLFILIKSKIKFKGISLIEPAIVILTIHLISGVTWKAHLVSLSLVFAFLVADIWTRRSQLKFYDYFCLAYLAIISFLGQILIGKKGQIYMNGWGSYTFVMIFCFIFLLIAFYRQAGKELRPQS